MAENIIQYKLERVKFEDRDILYRLLQYSLFEESLTDLNEMTKFGISEFADKPTNYYNLI